MILSRGEPVHSSMYKNLKTNLPKELMMFPGIPFNPSNNSFIHHSQVHTLIHSSFSGTSFIPLFTQ